MNYQTISSTAIALVVLAGSALTCTAEDAKALDFGLVVQHGRIGRAARVGTVTPGQHDTIFLRGHNAGRAEEGSLIDNHRLCKKGLNGIEGECGNG